MILCLDKSGSMAGTPYNALKEGAKLVGKSIFDNDEFEHFATLFYDQRADAFQCKKYEDYERKVNSSNASGGTSFGACFSWIIDFIT